MAAPLMAGAAIAGAANFLGAGMTASSQARINRQQMKFQREMWEKTNAYNHPLSQRQRLEQAGLNPNLVYGQSAGGAAGTASHVSQPDLKAVDYSAPAAAIGNAASHYFSMAQAQTGIEVQKAREENIHQDTVNKGIDSVNKTIQAASGTLDYKTKLRLYNNTVKTAEAQLEQINANTAYTTGKNARETMITNETLNKLGAEIQNLKTRGVILNEEAIMKKIDRELYERWHIRPSDPLYYRVLGELFEALNLKNFKN